MTYQEEKNDRVTYHHKMPIESIEICEIFPNIADATQ